MNKDYIEMENTEEKTALDVPEEKEPLMERAKKTFNKVRNSKAAKFAGGVGLVALGALGTMLMVGRKAGEDGVVDVIDADEIFVESTPTE